MTQVTEITINDRMKHIENSVRLIMRHLLPILRNLSAYFSMVSRTEGLLLL